MCSKCAKAAGFEAAKSAPVSIPSPRAAALAVSASAPEKTESPLRVALSSSVDAPAAENPGKCKKVGLLGFKARGPRAPPHAPPDCRNRTAQASSQTIFGYVTTVAGSSGGYADGAGSNAKFNWPSGVAVDALGWIYVLDSGNQAIRKISPAGVVTTWAGSTIGGGGGAGYADGTGTNALFRMDSLAQIALDGSL
jgi:hypothetical protein